MFENPYGLTVPFFVLAPMDDVTDTSFRQIIQNTSSPDLFFTEFVNVDGLESPGRDKLIRKLKFVESETKLIAQLWGLIPENFYKVASQIADGSLARELGLTSSNFIGVDLNMGCPQKNEISSGACAALMNNRELAEEIIEATKKGLDGKLPISVKTRIGFSEIDYSWPEFLLKQNLNMLTIHGRTKSQKSNGLANWQAIVKIREIRDLISPNTLIIGNGDVLSREQGLDYINEYKLDGIMIGRGIFHDPFVFSKNSPWPNYSKKQRLDLYRAHVNIFKNTWINNERPIHVLNKFTKVYINDFSGAKDIRMKLMNCKSADSLLEEIDNLAIDS
jgi:tRNA-dihydrouridine synthase